MEAEVVTLSAMDAVKTTEKSAVVKSDEAPVAVSNEPLVPFRLPCLALDGTLVIPFDADPKYHWWNKGAQSVIKTKEEVLARMASQSAPAPSAAEPARL